jgi:hypothetical protein
VGGLLTRDRDDDRDRALALMRTVVGQPAASERLASEGRLNLGNVLAGMAWHRNRTDRPTEAADLAAEAITVLRAELPSATSEVRRIAVLVNLGGALIELHVATASLGRAHPPEKLEEAIRHLDQVLTMRLTEPDRAEAETWLARALTHRLDGRPHHPDHVRAEALVAAALQRTPTGHPRRPEREELAARLGDAIGG